MATKAQVSMEVLGYYAVLMAVFLVTLAFIINSQNSIQEERKNTDARRILAFAKNEIDIAVNIGDGYTREIFLPYDLYGGINYTISILPEYQEILVSYEDRNISLLLLTDNISSSIKHGRSIIRNSKGAITFE